MDATRFDALIRSLGDGTTRRGIARLLAGLTLGGLLRPLPGEARKRRHGKRKSKGKDRDNGEKDKPDDARTEARATRDGKKGRKRRKDKTSEAGQAALTCLPPGKSCTGSSQCCSGTCARGVCLCTAASHCPAPGPCQTRACRGGKCTLEPEREGAACDDGDACTDGSRCDSQGHCVAGTAKACDDGVACTVDGCDPATGCTHTPDDARCTGGKVCDRQLGCVCDGTRCGAACPCSGGQVCNSGQCVCDATVSCGANCPCPHNQVCQSGQCTCPQGAVPCGERCVDTQTDPSHCGACSTPCDGGAGTCRGGVCATPEVCDNADNDFDGEIDEGALCPGNKVCQDGRCGCPAGTADCDGDDACEQLGTDQHCADCRPCAGGKVCQGGTCDCVAGQCGDACPCPNGQVCQGGTCVPATTPVCGNGTCEAGETCSTCPEDCGACPPSCGDGVCNGSENCQNCPADCGPCPFCGDGVCSGRERCITCPYDCGECPETGTECTTVDDCVPEQCCHAWSCVPRALDICNGSNGACDGGCNLGTMDCGQGACDCQSGWCVAVLF